MKIYYAHSQWKYGTKIEDYELRLIREYFPNTTIINPAKDIEQSGTEEEVMKRCLEEVDGADLLVFSSVDGTIGNGVLREVEAVAWMKPVLYIQNGALIPLTKLTVERKEFGDEFSYRPHAEVISRQDI